MIDILMQYIDDKVQRIYSENGLEWNPMHCMQFRYGHMAAKAGKESYLSSITMLHAISLSFSLYYLVCEKDAHARAVKVRITERSWLCGAL